MIFPSSGITGVSSQSCEQVLSVEWLGQRACTCVQPEEVVPRESATPAVPAGLCGPDCSAPLSHLEFLDVFPFNLPVGSDIARCSHVRHCGEAPCCDIIAHSVTCP